MMTTRQVRSGRARAAGFSTADVLVGMGLSLMALFAIYAFSKSQTKALAAQSVYSESQNVTRSVIDLMTRELRMASYDPSNVIAKSLPGASCPNVIQGIVEATPSKIHFQQNLNGGSTINTSGGEDVIYDVLGSTLRRTDGTALPEELVSGLLSNGFVLQYYNGSNPPVELIPTGNPPALSASQRDCVAKVRITVRAKLTDSSTAGAYGLTSLAESEIAIRNRSLNNF